MKTKSRKAIPKAMPAGMFKARCLAVMDEVQAKRQSIVITKRGRPVVKLVPIDADLDDFYNFMHGKGTIVRDVIKPAIPADAWGSD